MKQILLKKYASRYVFVAMLVLCFASAFNAPVALLCGVVLAFTLGNPFPKFSHNSTNWVLKTSVVGLGFGMNAHSAVESGKDGFLLTVFSIGITIFLGYFLGKKLHIDRRTSHLVSAGTAICGGSAIAAVAPVVKANDNEVSVSLAIVFLLNSLALFVFPAIGHWLQLSQHDFGVWSAIAIHDTSSVVGAAQIYGEEALRVATTVKLARALWIVPVAIVSATVFKGDQKQISMPYFIGLFVLAMLCNTFFPQATSLFQKPILSVSKMGLTACLFLIGAGLSWEKIQVVGWKPMLLGVVLWVFISAISLIAIVL